MTGPKTNEREGTAPYCGGPGSPPNKAREVLNLVRGRPVAEAEEILRFSERTSPSLVGKLLHSAVANAQNNDDQDPSELYVSACFADEGTTIKRWRPWARLRHRIRKRTSHITLIVTRLPDEDLIRLQNRRRADLASRRTRRVAAGRAAETSGRRGRAPATAGPSTGAEPTVAEVAAIEDEQGIVDETAAAVAAAEEAETISAETSPEETPADEVGEAPSSRRSTSPPTRPRGSSRLDNQRWNNTQRRNDRTQSRRRRRAEDDETNMGEDS